MVLLACYILMTKVILLVKYFKLQTESDEVTYNKRRINEFITQSFYIMWFTTAAYLALCSCWFKEFFAVRFSFISSKVMADNTLFTLQIVLSWHILSSHVNARTNTISSIDCNTVWFSAFWDICKLCYSMAPALNVWFFKVKMVVETRITG